MLFVQLSPADASVGQRIFNLFSNYFPKIVIATIFACISSVSVISPAVADGITWTSRTSAADNDWATIAYGNGLWVAVSNHNWWSGGQIMTSPDGITWTIRNAAANNSWRSVAYGNGLWVAVAQSGSGNQVMTSTDGITWTSRNEAANLWWQAVAYGNGLWVATAQSGSGNRVMTSPDGITWTSRTSAADNDWHSVAYGNGLWVAVAQTGTGNRVMTSPDGITWTSRTSAADNQWHSVVYGNGLWVAVAQSGSGNRVMTSPDGITWTSRTSAADNSWRSVAYGNGLWVAVAHSGSGNRVMTSPDGITWTSRNAAVENFWRSVAYGNGLWVAVAQSGTGNRVMTSGLASSKTTPTLTWSNVSKSYGDSPFILTAPTASTAGTFTYSSATTSVISLTSDTATVVAPGTSVITASFTPTDTATYNSATTTMTVTVSKAAQSTLTFALSTASKNQPYSQAITMTPSGGSGTGAITYAIAAGGTATGCALANATETNTVTATSGGTCLIRATKATDTNYLVATSATQTFTFNAPLTLTYAVGDSGTGTAPTLSGTYFAGDTVTVATGSALSRAGFTFDGWRNTSNTSVAAGSTFTFSINDTLTAQWRQTSLYGLSDSEITELQSWNASTNTNSGTVSNARSSFTVTVPGSSLPTGTTVKLWEVANSNLARSRVGSDKDYIVNLVVSWLKSDGTVPTASSPVTLTISNSTIRSGAIAYQIIGDTVTQIGTATTDGVINLSVTEDPVIAVANPAVVAAASSGGGGGSGGGGSGGGSAGVSSAPVITETKPVEEVKKVEEAKPVVVEQLKSILKMQHKVTFGRSASWINTNNIRAIREFMSQALKNMEVEKVIIEGYEQPSKITLPKIDVVRAKAVRNLLRNEGYNYSVFVKGMGEAKSRNSDSSRVAILTVEGKPKS